jgi:membrane associated rhomboid family serine protease
MNPVWILGNAVIVIGSFVCLAYVYGRAELRGTQWPRWSTFIVAVTALVTGLQFVYPELISAFQRNREGLLAGEWWRMVTPLLVQPQGIAQALLNLVLMVAFLPVAEKLYGSRVLLIYLASGIIGQIPNYFWNPYGGGSSTAVFGTMGAIFAFTIRERTVLPRAYVVIGASAIVAGLALTIARDGHGAGMLAGALIGSLLGNHRPISRQAIVGTADAP